MATITGAPTMLANRQLGNMNGWQDRHDNAVLLPRGFERPIIHLLRAWVDYAQRHQAQYDAFIGDDGVLGPEWSKLGEAIDGLLDGPTDRLDCGTLRTFIHDYAVYQHTEVE